MVEKLIAIGLSVNSRDEYLHALLFYCVIINLFSLINFLGFLTSIIFGRTPLHYAAREGRQDIINILVKNGAAVNSPDDYGKDPISFAKYHFHTAFSFLSSVPFPSSVLLSFRPLDAPTRLSSSSFLSLLFAAFL